MDAFDVVEDRRDLLAAVLVMVSQPVSLDEDMDRYVLDAIDTVIDHLGAD